MDVNLKPDTPMTIEERYELLQAVCRQQILVNETLKSELEKLNQVINNISRERSLLLDELVINHSSCQKVPSETLKSNKRFNTNASDKRPGSSLLYRSNNEPKKMKSESRYGNDEIEEDSRQTDDVPEMNLVLESENDWNNKDNYETSSNHSEMLPNSPSSTNKSKLHYQITQVRQSSGHPKTCGLIDSGGEVKSQPRTSTNWNACTTRSGSPPIITQNTQRITATGTSSNNFIPSQRFSRVASLVTNSSLCSSNSSVPFVTFGNHRTAALSSQPKYVSVANRSVKFVSSGNPNVTPSIQVSSPNSIIKSVTSPPISPGVRISSTSSGNQRIVIQPGTGTVRSIIIPRTQAHIDENSCEVSYSDR